MRPEKGISQAARDKVFEKAFREARHTLAAAKKCRRRDALSMLRIISYALACRCRIPEDVAQWFAPALFKMGWGESVDEALGIPGRTPGEGKEGAVAAERARGWAMAYRVGYLLTEKKNLTLDEAAEDVAEEFGCEDSSTVKKAYRKRRLRVEKDLELRSYLARIVETKGA
jgi:hypothetical protein